jgi:glycosyltransferase involved in cell wall biosynthesis
LKIVLLYDELKLGGTEKLFVTMANLLHQHQHEVTVVLINTPAVLDDTLNVGIRKVYLDRKNKLSFRPMRQLALICKTVDIIHVHTYYNWRYLFFSALVNSRGRAKVVLHEHSDLRNINNVDRMILPRLNASIAVNEQQAMTLKKAGVPTKKIFVIPNIVGQQIRVQPRSRAAYKILMVGNIRREKNYELAIEILAKSALPLQLDIYGNINDSTYHQELLKLISDKQLTSRITFISNDTNIAEHYGEYDLALHTASNETGPLVVLEYLSAGMPFLCSVAGQSPRLIQQHMSNAIVKTFEVNDWLNSVQSFYSSSEPDRQQLSKQLLATANDLLNTKAYYKKLLGVYEFMLAPKHAAV